MHRLFVGNLPFSVTDRDLAAHVSAFAPVRRASVVTDRETLSSRGFAFVTFANEADAERARVALDGSDFLGRRLTVRVATEKPTTKGATT